MLDRSAGELALICRDQASLTTNRQARESLLKMAEEYETQAAMSSSVVDSLFHEEARGAFRDGYIFRSAPDLANAQADPDSGYWNCDVADQNRLTWSRKVYELFDLPAGTPVERDWAVARYSERSRSTLERVRKYALSRDFGFILDAEIETADAGHRWIRVLAVPIIEDGRIVRLHGVKRTL